LGGGCGAYGVFGEVHEFAVVGSAPAAVEVVQSVGNSGLVFFAHFLKDVEEWSGVRVFVGQFGEFLFFELVGLIFVERAASVGRDVFVVGVVAGAEFVDQRRCDSVGDGAFVVGRSAHGAGFPLLEPCGDAVVAKGVAAGADVGVGHDFHAGWAGKGLFHELGVDGRWGGSVVWGGVGCF